MRRPAGIFTIDVENWYHILDLGSVPPIERWAELPSRVERNFERLLARCEAAGGRAWEQIERICAGQSLRRPQLCRLAPDYFLSAQPAGEQRRG